LFLTSLLPFHLCLLRGLTHPPPALDKPQMGNSRAFLLPLFAQAPGVPPLQRLTTSTDQPPEEWELRFFTPFTFLNLYGKALHISRSSHQVLSLLQEVGFVPSVIRLLSPDRVISSFFRFGPPPVRPWHFLLLSRAFPRACK